MSFEEAYKNYLNYVSKRHKKQGLVALASNFNSRILPYFKGKDISNISKIDILGWQNYIYDLNFKNSYNDKLLIELRKFLKFCHNYYDINESIYLTLEPFVKKCEDNKSDFYTIQEFNKFIKCVDNEIYKQFFTFMFFTGTRPGETFALRFSDLEENIIHIRHNLTTKGGRTLDTPKNYSSIRDIKIDNILKKDLLKLKKYYYGKYKVPDTDLFIFGGIKPLSPSSCNRHKKKACYKANLRPITLHQFRHSHATLLLSNGIMLNEVSRRLGHSKTSTTLNVYCHTSLEQEKKSIRTLNFLRFNLFALASNFNIIKSIFKHFFNA